MATTIHFPHARPTGVLTADGKRIYDLEPYGDLCMVAGSTDFDPRLIDQEDLPAGFRWVGCDEWESLNKIDAIVYAMNAPDCTLRYLYPDGYLSDDRRYAAATVPQCYDVEATRADAICLLCRVTDY